MFNISTARSFIIRFKSGTFVVTIDVQLGVRFIFLTVMKQSCQSQPMASLLQTVHAGAPRARDTFTMAVHLTLGDSNNLKMGHLIDTNCTYFFASLAPGLTKYSGEQFMSTMFK